MEDGYICLTGQRGQRERSLSVCSVLCTVQDPMAHYLFNPSCSPVRQLYCLHLTESDFLMVTELSMAGVSILI